MHTVYRTTNLISGEIYVGKHSCRCVSCSYIGSGKVLKAAVRKYGIENFRKEILFSFDTEDEMNAKEAEIVTEEFCARNDTYNLCAGGRGGWGYINQVGLADRSGAILSEETKRLIGEKSLNRKHTEETKQKIADANVRTNASRGKKVSEKLKGGTKSAEHRKKISDAIRKRNALKKCGCSSVAERHVANV